MGNIDSWWDTGVPLSQKYPSNARWWIKDSFLIFLFRNLFYQFDKLISFEMAGELTTNKMMKDDDVGRSIQWCPFR